METVTLVCAVVPFMFLDTVQHAPENPSFLVYSGRFSDGEKALQWINATNQNMFIANLFSCPR